LTFKAEFVLIDNWRGSARTAKVFIRKPILVTPMPPRLDLSPRPLSLPAAAGERFRRNPRLRAKADPYASKTQKRIDVLLLVVTMVILFLVLHASAHG
jgi:hypothetical protein